MILRDMLITNKKTKNKKMIMMKLPSLFFKSTAEDMSSWPWTTCRQTRTLSFRTNAVAAAATESSGSESTASELSGEDPIERMIRGIRPTERLLFEGAGKSRSILREEENGAVWAALEEGTTVIEMDSEEPFRDFRKSMEEMVVARGMKDDWERLEELLSYYLRINGRNKHGFIVAAFVDLLVTLSMSSSSNLLPSASHCLTLKREKTS